ncbi:MAG: polysaccharide deacetylase family protein [Clostridia bacterium]|nr:polysaccharide deacetylase family protein [Clostridia bacterium]
MLETSLKTKIKKCIFKSISFFAYCTGVYALLDKLFDRKGVYIVFYHRLVKGDEEKLISASSVDYKNFEKQARYFTQKYEVISMDEASSILSGKEQPQKKYLVVTFDDGYRDNFTYGYEVLKKYRLKPTIFITANNVDKQEYLWPDLLKNIVFNTKRESVKLNFQGLSMEVSIKSYGQKIKVFDLLKRYIKKCDETQKKFVLSYLSEALEVKPDKKCSLMLEWDDVYKLIDIGVDIGNHTMNHPILSNLTCEEIRSEIYEAEKLLEGRIKRKIQHFAYPNGKKSDYNQCAKEELVKGYRTACTTLPGINLPGTDMYELKRIGMAYDMNIIDVKVKILCFKILHAYKNFRSSGNSAFEKKVIKEI